jgi:hypothetical protein
MMDAARLALTAAIACWMLRALLLLLAGGLAAVAMTPAAKYGAGATPLGIVDMPLPVFECCCADTAEPWLSLAMGHRLVLAALSEPPATATADDARLLLGATGIVWAPRTTPRLLGLLVPPPLLLVLLAMLLTLLLRMCRGWFGKLCERRLMRCNRPVRSARSCRASCGVAYTAAWQLSATSAEGQHDLHPV